MTGKKLGCPSSLVSYSHFSTDRTQYQGKFAMFSMCACTNARWRRHKLCAVRMRNAVLGNDLKLFSVDIVPSSSADITRALRGCFPGASVYVSFRFVSFQSKGKPPTLWGCLLWYNVFWLQAKELRLSVCFNTFRNFNKRRMSPAQTITTEWVAEKWVDKRVQSKQTLKHKLGNRTNRWSKVQ